MWNHTARGVKAHSNLCNRLYISAEPSVLLSDMLMPGPDETKSKGLPANNLRGTSAARQGGEIQDTRERTMKHKIQLNGAAVLVIMTICMALFALVPSVISAMKTPSSSSTDCCLSQRPVTEQYAAVR